MLVSAHRSGATLSAVAFFPYVDRLEDCVAFPQVLNDRKGDGDRQGRDADRRSPTLILKFID